MGNVWVMANTNFSLNESSECDAKSQGIYELNIMVNKTQHAGGGRNCFTSYKHYVW